MNLSPLPIQQFFGNNGRPLDGGWLFTYEAGTSNKIATYTDESGLSQNTNPIVLDFRGEARIWLDPELSYKFILSPRGDSDPPTKAIWTVDNISSGLTTADITQQFIGRLLWPRTSAEVSAGVTPVNYAYPPGYAERYGATGSGDAGPGIERMLSAEQEGNPLSELTANRTYSLNTWTTFNDANPMRIIGYGAALEGPSSAVDFADPSATLLIKGITFDHWRSVLHRESTEGGTVSRPRIFDSRLTDLSDVGINLEVAINDLYVHRNLWEDAAGGYSLRIGEDVAANQDTWKKLSVCFNNFLDVDGSGTTNAGGMILYGKETAIIGNMIEDVDSVDGEAWGIYTKCRFNSIAFNIVRDVNATSSDSAWGINVKGNVKADTATPQGFMTRVIGNHVENIRGETNSGGYGIRIETDDVICIGNTALDCRNTGIAADADSSAGGTNVLILGNLARFTTVNSTIGVRVAALLNDINVSHNIVQNALIGVSLTSIDGTETDRIVSYNLLDTDGTSGEGIVVRRDKNFSGIDLVGNRVTRGSIGIRFESGSGVLSNVRVLDNDLQATTTPLSGTLPADIQIRHMWKFQTTAAGPTTAITLTLPDESAFMAELRAVGMKTDGADRAMYHREALFYRDGGGGATLQGTVQDLGTPQESNAAWDATMDASGNTVRVRLTGAAATTINWKLSLNIIAVGA